MDLVKIGKYIAGKRRDLGFTQKQLAEKLGMSDKSVSKWERGVCLPDVSVYMDLWSVLGISINEFLAGEDIEKEKMIEKSEDNLIQVTTDSKHKQKKLKIILAVLTVVVIAALSVLAVLLRSRIMPRNYLAPLSSDSPEMKTAEMLSGIDGAFLYRFHTDDPFEKLTLTVYEVRSGEKKIWSEMNGFNYESTGSPTEGMIILIPDFENKKVKVIIADDKSKLSTELGILDEKKDYTYYGRMACYLESEEDIRYGREQGLVFFAYGEKETRIISLQACEEGDFPRENEIAYYFTVSFSKDQS